MGHCLLFLSKTPQYTKYFNFRLQKTPYLRHQSQTSSEHRSDLLSGSYQCECTIPCTGSSFSILWQWYQDSFGFKSTSFEGALRQVLNMQPRQARKLQSASLVLVKSVYHHTWLQVKLLSESVYFLLLCFSFLFFSFSFFVFSRQKKRERKKENRKRKTKKKRNKERNYHWADEMVHWVRGLAAKLDNLGSISRTHLVEGENGSHKLSSHHYSCTGHVCTCAHSCAHMQKINT